MALKQTISRWYPREEQRRSEILLRRMIDDFVEDGSCVLDVGAGAGEWFSYSLKERVKDMVGVDMDPRVKTNPLLHRGLCCSFTSIPIEDNYFDVVFCHSVLEHVSEPSEFLAEMRRVLKPGGRFIFLTPNKWHYFAIVARLTPYWFHQWYNLRMHGVKKEDTFPTVYRLNTVGSLRRALFAAGFEEEILTLRETSPNYLCWSFPTFYLGLIYERLVNSTSLLARFRIHLLGSYKKRL